MDSFARMVKICAAELVKSLISSHSALFMPWQHRHSFSPEEKQKTSSANETVTSKQLCIRLYTISLILHAFPLVAICDL